MASIGTLELGVDVKGAAEAQKRVKKLEDSIDQTGETTEDTSDRLSGLSGSLDTVKEKLNDNITGFRRFSNFAAEARESLSGLSGSSITGGIAGAITGGSLAGIGSRITSGIAGGISGGAIAGKITGALSGISAATLSSIGAGIVGGLGISTALEQLGILPFFERLGQDIRSALGQPVVDAFRSLFAPGSAILAIVGGFSAGFAENIEDGLVEGVKGGIDGALGALSQLKSSVSRTFDRVVNLRSEVLGKFGNAFDNVLGKVKDIKSTVDDIVSSFKNLPSADLGIGSGSIIDSIPGSDIAGDVISGLPTPSLDVGGRIEESGIAEVHKGEVVVPNNFESSPSSETTEKTINVNNPRFVFDDSNVSNMSRSEKRQLAKDLANAMGDQILRNIQ